MKSTRETSILRLRKGFNSLTVRADILAVHKKKFNFFISQSKHFCKWYMKLPKGDIIDKKEFTVIENVLQIWEDVNSLITQYNSKTWTVNIMDNSVNHVFQILINYSNAMNESISNIYLGPFFFTINPKDWEQYNVYDLLTIKAAFINYAQCNQKSAELYDKLQKRLKSIDLFLVNTSRPYPEVHNLSPLPVTFQQWKVSLSDFDKIKKIGTGLSADVYLAIDKRTKKMVAIKQLKYTNLSGSRLHFYQREIAVLAIIAQSGHPSLLHFIGATDSHPFAIITEFMPNGSLYEELTERHHFSQTQKTIAAFDIARGMQFLHSCQIVHRDLKSLNILLDKNDHVKICDFGFSRKSDGETDSFSGHRMGTPLWMAPEILTGESRLTLKIDVYAYGIVLSEIANGHKPDLNCSAKELREYVADRNFRPSLPPDLNPQMKDLIAACWHKDPDQRPTFDEIVDAFRSGEVVFNHTNVKEFLKYMEDSSTSSEIDISDLKSAIEKLKKDKIDIYEMAEILKKQDSLPPDLINTVWPAIHSKCKEIIHPYHYNHELTDDMDQSESINENGSENDSILHSNVISTSKILVSESSSSSDSDDEEVKGTSIFVKKPNVLQFSSRSHDSIDRSEPMTIVASRLLKIFASTSKKGSASILFRNAPVNSIDQSTLERYLEEIPTGSKETDHNIIVAACRNGLARMAALFAVDNDDIIFTLNLVSHLKPSNTLQTAIADKCIQAARICPDARYAAIKCLLIHNQEKRLPDSIILDFLKDSSTAKQQLAIIAIASKYFSVAIKNSNVKNNQYNLLKIPNAQKQRSKAKIDQSIKQDPESGFIIINMPEPEVIDEQFEFLSSDESLKISESSKNESILNSRSNLDLKEAENGKDQSNPKKEESSITDPNISSLSEKSTSTKNENISNQTNLMESPSGDHKESDNSKLLLVEQLQLMWNEGNQELLSFGLAALCGDKEIAVKVVQWEIDGEWVPGKGDLRILMAAAKNPDLHPLIHQCLYQRNFQNFFIGSTESNIFSSFISSISK